MYNLLTSSSFDRTSVISLSRPIDLVDQIIFFEGLVDVRRLIIVPICILMYSLLKRKPLEIMVKFEFKNAKFGNQVVGIPFVFRF